MNVVIVGHGRMGQFHAKTVREAGDEAITLDPYAPADHKLWTDIPANVDAAIIATPIPDLHTHALYASHRGLRVLVEKPATATLAQAEHLHRKYPHTAVGYLERANPVVAGLKHYCPNPSHVRYTRQGPRSEADWLDVASHDIDLHHHHWPTANATYNFGYAAWPRRTIQIGDYTANLVTRTIHHNHQLVAHYPMDDLLATQWAAFKAGLPLATIKDAIRVHQTINKQTTQIAA